MHGSPPTQDLRAILLAGLRDFWAVGIDKVSPGALGMRLRGQPFEQRDIAHLIAQIPEIEYVPGVGPRWDHGWIVRRDITDA